jgi:hypothetical protein
MNCLLKNPRLWLLAILLLMGIAASLPLILRTRESVSEARLRKVRVGMSQDEVIAVLGPPNGDGNEGALLWRADSFLRTRKDRLWVTFEGGSVNGVQINEGEPDKRSLLERIRDWWDGSQDGFESYL